MNGELEQYELIKVFGFTSERKMMTVLVKDSKGRMLAFTKGADEVIS